MGRCFLVALLFSGALLLSAVENAFAVSTLNQSTVIRQIAIYGTKDVASTLDGNGELTQSYNYSPNGVNQAVDKMDSKAFIQPKPINVNITQNPFQYSGEYQDLESGLYYQRARYYSPSIQRFIQRDSYNLINRYDYANGNPILNIDPSGHMSSGSRLSLGIGLTEIFIGLLLGGFGGQYFIPNGFMIAGGIGTFRGAGAALYNKNLTAKEAGIDSISDFFSSFIGLGSEIYGGKLARKGFRSLIPSANARVIKALGFVTSEYFAANMYNNNLYQGHFKKWLHGFIGPHEWDYLLTAGLFESTLKPLSYNLLTKETYALSKDYRGGYLGWGRKNADMIQIDKMGFAEQMNYELRLTTGKYRNISDPLYGGRSINLPRAMRVHNFVRMLNSRVYYTARSAYRTFANQGQGFDESQSTIFISSSVVLSSWGLRFL